MTHINSWKREVKRLTKVDPKISGISLILANRMTHYLILHFLMCFTIYEFCGWSSLKFHLIYAFIGMTWLEMVNYLEHYGLRREVVK